MTATDYHAVEQQLCKALCADVTVRERKDGSLHVQTPFSFPDGDGFSMYLDRLSSGGFRLSDKGSTLMHMSYDQDVDKLKEGTRSKIFDQILAEMGVQDDDGEIYLDAAADRLGESVFRFGQALTRIHDLSFLNRVQVESTFYEDLFESLQTIAGDVVVQKDYVAPGVPKAEDYKADYGIVGTQKPVLVFGVPNQTKARLATVVLQYLRQFNFDFRSLVVYADMSTIPRGDVSRLTNAADIQVASNQEYDTLKRKLAAEL